MDFLPALKNPFLAMGLLCVLGQAEVSSKKMDDEEDETLTIALPEEDDEPLPRAEDDAPPGPDEGWSRRRRRSSSSSSSSDRVEEEEPPAAMRCDVARGMLREAGDAVVLDDAVDAPPFVMAFEVEEPTAPPTLLLDMVCMLLNVTNIVEKGERGAFIPGLPGFRVDMDPGGHKSIVYRLNADDGGKTHVAELRIEIRVQRVSAPTEDGREVEDVFLLLVGRSPLPFSLRRAVYISTQTVGRLVALDGRGANERRNVWAQAAMHVWATLHPAANKGDMLTRYSASSDWMRSGEADGFTCLFSMQRAVDWMRARFQARHPGRRFTGPLRVHGVAARMRLAEGDGGEPFLMTPVFRDECRTYDGHVDEELRKSASEAPNKRRRRGRSEEDDDGPPPPAVVQPYRGVGLENGEQRLPECLLSIRVVMRTNVETTMQLEDVRQHLRVFPESVMLELLRLQMQGRNELGQRMEREMRAQTVGLTVGELRDLVMGNESSSLPRVLLAWGDAEWGRHMMRVVNEAGEARLQVLEHVMAMAFELAYTRAKGSEGYTHARAAAFGQYMFLEQGAASKGACRAAYERMARRSGGVHGSAAVQAQEFMLDVLVECDACMWNFRPDNMYLFLQFMISDVMLVLNYYHSAIDGAYNGIGSTIVVRDGGGNYYRWYKDADGKGTATLGQVQSKGNGTGADHTMGAYKKSMELDKYDRRINATAVKAVFSELKRTSEAGMWQYYCHLLERMGTRVTVKQRVQDADQRHFASEMKGSGDQQAVSNITALVWLIARNTTSDGVTSYKTTREDPTTKRRVVDEYLQAVFGFMLICANAIAPILRERMHTILAVSRSVTSSADGVDVEQMMRQAQRDDGAMLDTMREEERARTRNGAMDKTGMAGREADFFETARPILFLGMGTTLFAGFMQWTGMLDKVRETRRAEAILRAFDAQLGLMDALLNPDMIGSGHRRRFMQVRLVFPSTCARL